MKKTIVKVQLSEKQEEMIVNGYPIAIDTSTDITLRVLAPDLPLLTVSDTPFKKNKFVFLKRNLEADYGIRYSRFGKANPDTWFYLCVNRVQHFFKKIPERIYVKG